MPSFSIPAEFGKIWKEKKEVHTAEVHKAGVHVTIWTGFVKRAAPKGAPPELSMEQRVMVPFLKLAVPATSKVDALVTVRATVKEGGTIDDMRY